MSLLPSTLHQYFWDYDVSTLDTQKHAFLILKRILDRGKTSDVRWALHTYSPNDIRSLLQTTRDLSRPTATYWANMLNIDHKEVVCLHKPYSQTRFGLSS